MFKGEYKLADNKTAILLYKRVLLSSHAYLGSATGQKWLLTLVDQGIVSATSFLTTVVIGRTCAKEQLGLYFLGLTIVGLLMELQNILICSPYTALSPRLQGVAHSLYTGSTLVHQWGLAVFSMLVMAGSGFLLSRGWGPPGLESVVWMLALAAPFITFREYARRVCFAGLQIKVALWLDSCAALFQGSALLALGYLGKLSAVHAFGIIGMGAFLAGLLWLPWARKVLTFSRLGIVSDLGRNWSFGRWFLGANLAIFLGCQTYPWILTGLHGTAAVAALAACLGVVGLVNPFLQGTTNFFAPKAARAFAQGGLAALRAFVRKTTFAIGLVMAFFCIGIAFFGSDLIIFFYGPQYVGLGLVIAILSLYTLVNALAMGVDYGIWAMGRPDLNFRIELVHVLITLTLGLWLVQAFGVIGAAWGLLIGTIAVSVVYGLVFSKVTSVAKG